MKSVVLFENEHFVICDKAAQVLSVPARELSDSRECLGLELQKHYKKNVFPVHRLDFEVSGLIMYAFNSSAHKASQDWFQSKKIKKKYLALTQKQNWNHWPENVKTDLSIYDLDELIKTQKVLVWKTQMLKGKKRTYESNNGEWAETRAQLINISGENLLWRLSPVTGKSHQLRFELSRRGFPIKGDHLYGSKVEHEHKGIALRSVELDLSDCDYKKWGLATQYSVKGYE